MSPVGSSGNQVIISNSTCGAPDLALSPTVGLAPGA
jgi:hypothetical protein